VAFEIARRHRFARDMANLPDDATVHVLPTGADEPPRHGDLASLRYRDFGAAQRRIEAARRATAQYLATAPERTG
jgi:NTE family protein